MFNFIKNILKQDVTKEDITCDCECGCHCCCDSEEPMLLPYSYVYKVRKNYKEFIINKIMNTNTVKVRDSYSEDEFINEFINVANTKDKVYKKVLKNRNDFDLVVDTLNDACVDWDNLSKEDLKLIKYDAEIISACKNAVKPFVAILTDNTLSYTEKEITNTWDYILNALQLVAYGFSYKGIVFIDTWYKKDNDTSLVEYCLEQIRNEK